MQAYIHERIKTHLHYLSLQLDLQNPELDDLPPTYQEGLDNKVVIDYSKIIKANDFRHLCDNVRSKEVSLLCVFCKICCFSFDLMLKNKKKRYQKK